MRKTDLSRAERKEALAEAVSELGNVHRAAERIGVSWGYARNIWAEIKRDLGWQAA